jgi:transposase
MHMLTPLQILRRHLLFEFMNSTVADVSRKENVDDLAAGHLLNRYMKTKADFSNIRSLGILRLHKIILKNEYKHFVTLRTCRIDSTVHILAAAKGR